VFYWFSDSLRAGNSISSVRAAAMDLDPFNDRPSAAIERAASSDAFDRPAAVLLSETNCPPTRQLNDVPSPVLSVEH